MTLPTIEQLEAMMAAATTGPWFVPGQPDVVCSEGFTKQGAAKVVTTASSPKWMELGEPSSNATLIALAPTLAAQRIADAARIDALEGFIRDLSATKFDALPRPFITDPQDTPDDATDLAAVLAWQDDARDLLNEVNP